MLLLDPILQKTKIIKPDWKRDSNAFTLEMKILHLFLTYRQHKLFLFQDVLYSNNFKLFRIFPNAFDTIKLMYITYTCYLNKGKCPYYEKQYLQARHI